MRGKVAAPRPRQQAVGRPCVDDALKGHPVLAGGIAAKGLPLELTSGMGVGIDRKETPEFNRSIEQIGRWIESFWPAVQLDGGAKRRTGSEHDIGVEGGFGALTNESAGAMPKHINVR